MDRTTFALMFGAAAGQDVIGQQQWTTPGAYTWVCPEGVYSVCAVAIGAGSSSGGGGGLGWRNEIPTTPGASYTVQVGSPISGTGDSFFNLITLVAGKKSTNGAVGGTFVGQGGGNGGAGNRGGGGAGGYSGNGGNGGARSAAGFSGSGGGGGGGGGAAYTEEDYGPDGDKIYTDYVSGGGGGTGIYGQGASGAGGAGGVNAINQQKGYGGTGGSNGGNGETPPVPQVTEAGGDGGLFGGGGGKGYTRDLYDAQTDQSFNDGYTSSGAGQVGAVRIIYGQGRAFPSTRTADE